MKKIALSIGFALLWLPVSAQNPILPEHKDWLEMVDPIMTRAEREVFLSLAKKSDRDMFIRVFWKQRDAIPETPENEFQKEYLDRVGFADRTFHDATGKRGSLTERGFYHLLLGPPLERTQFSTHSELWPQELWFYKGDPELGLPPYYYLIFYQPDGLGAFRLYRPGLEGPEKLCTPFLNSRSTGRSAALESIRRVSSELASAAQSYIAGEKSLGLTSLGSETLIASLRSLPGKKYADAYARGFLRYKDYVETEYADRFIGAAFQARVFEHGGQAFLHWTVEPDKAGFAQTGDRVYAQWEAVLRIESPDGRAVLERLEEIPLRLTPGQYKSHERRRLAFQDILPVIPGSWKMFLLLKNKTSREFTSLDLSFRAAAPETEPAASEMLLYSSREPDPAEASPGLKAFGLGGAHYAFHANGEYQASARLGAVVQALRLDPGPDAECRFRLVGVGAEAPALDRTFRWDEVRREETGLIDLGLFETTGVPPGYYQASLAVVDRSGGVRLERKANLVLTSAPLPLLPWIISRQRPVFPSGEHLLLAGTQAYRAERFAEARSLAVRSLALREDNAARLLLGQALFGLTDYRAALEECRKVMDRAESREAGKLAVLCLNRLGRFEEGAELADGLLGGGVETALLNAAAEAHLGAGRPDQAAARLRKSLELDPAQPQARALLERAAKRLP